MCFFDVDLFSFVDFFDDCVFVCGKLVMMFFI